MRIILKSRRNTHFANAEFDGHSVIILPGCKINKDLSYAAMSKSVIALRNNAELVSPTGEVLKEIAFDSPSAAAQFVTGRSVNGYVAWRVDDRISLKKYLNEMTEVAQAGC